MQINFHKNVCCILQIFTANMEKNLNILNFQYHCYETIIYNIYFLVSLYITGRDLHIRLDTIVTTDVLKALERTKPSGKAMKDKYAAWQREYESV